MQQSLKAHVVIEPDTGLATVVGLTEASGPDNGDAAVGALDTVVTPWPGSDRSSAAPR